MAVTDAVRARLAAVESLQRLTEKLTAEQALALLAAPRAALERSLQQPVDADAEAQEWDAASAASATRAATTHKGSSSGAGGGKGGSSSDSSNNNGGNSSSNGGNADRGNGNSKDGAAVAAATAASTSAGGGGGFGADVLGTYLLTELQSHGAVAQGDQLHALVGEVGEVLRSAAFRLTLCDLVRAAFDTLGTEVAVAIQRESGAADDDLAGGAIPLAKLFAQLHRCSQSTFSQPSPFAEALLVTPALDELCWMAYSGEVSDGLA